MVTPRIVYTKEEWVRKVLGSLEILDAYDRKHLKAIAVTIRYEPALVEVTHGDELTLHYSRSPFFLSRLHYEQLVFEMRALGWNLNITEEGFDNVLDSLIEDLPKEDPMILRVIFRMEGDVDGEVFATEATDSLFAGLVEQMSLANKPGEIVEASPVDKFLCIDTDATLPCYSTSFDLEDTSPFDNAYLRVCEFHAHYLDDDKESNRRKDRGEADENEPDEGQSDEGQSDEGEADGGEADEGEADESEADLEDMPASPSAENQSTGAARGKQAYDESQDPMSERNFLSHFTNEDEREPENDENHQDDVIDDTDILDGRYPGQCSTKEEVEEKLAKIAEIQKDIKEGRRGKVTYEEIGVDEYVPKHSPGNGLQEHLDLLEDIELYPLMYNTTHQVMSSGIWTLCFFRDGKWYTPHVSTGCHLDPLRMLLLESGLIEEGIINLQGLEINEDVLMICAAHGVHRARLFGEMPPELYKFTRNRKPNPKTSKKNKGTANKNAAAEAEQSSRALQQTAPVGRKIPNTNVFKVNTKTRAPRQRR